MCRREPQSLGRRFLPFMKRIITAAALVLFALYIVYWAEPAIFVSGVQLFVLAALWEYCELAAEIAKNVNRPVVYLGGLALVLVGYLRPHLTLYALGLAFLILFALELARLKSPAEVVPAVASGLAGWIYVTIPFVFLVMLRSEIRAGARLILFLLFVLSVGDTAAYYAGRAFGKHKLAPLTSPGKTVEGAVASLLASVIAGGWLLSVWFSGLPRYHFVLLPVLLNLAGQIGDLAESSLKRGAGKKDSSSLLPGHGGVLDRIDALLFGAPVLWYYYVLALRVYF